MYYNVRLNLWRLCLFLVFLGLLDPLDSHQPSRLRSVDNPSIPSTNNIRRQGPTEAVPNFIIATASDVSWGEALRKGKRAALEGGVSGAIAGLVQVI